ncbi:hypothetical protein PUN28_007262 [Cardiocondyla obscurior]|uniref:Uncharacterized protein n=1 Tax=Cardiocondyla obscurior TaxID=286306 RepID=A0AAW2G2Z7_9HYME
MSKGMPSECNERRRDGPRPRFASVFASFACLDNFHSLADRHVRLLPHFFFFAAPRNAQAATCDGKYRASVSLLLELVTLAVLVYLSRIT